MVRLRIRYAKRFFGFGFGCNWGIGILADDDSERWKVFEYKIFLGPWIVLGNIPYGRVPLVHETTKERL